jgi:hypothetical protein
MGAVSLAAVKAEFEHRVEAGEFVAVDQRPTVRAAPLRRAR